MKKGQLIQKLILNKDHITVYDTDGVEVKLTRAQRQLFKRYKEWDFKDQVQKEFGKSHIFAPDFMILKDGELVNKHDA